MRLTSLKCVGHLFGRSAGHTCLFHRLISFLTCTWLWACFPRFPQHTAEMHHVRNQCACPRLRRAVHTGCSSVWKLTCDAAPDSHHLILIQSYSCFLWTLSSIHLHYSPRVRMDGYSVVLCAHRLVWRPLKTHNTASALQCITCVFITMNIG